MITDPVLANSTASATGFWSRRRKARSVCRTGPCRGFGSRGRAMKSFLWAPRPRRVQKVKDALEETAIIVHQRRYSTTKLLRGREFLFEKCFKRFTSSDAKSSCGMVLCSSSLLSMMGLIAFTLNSQQSFEQEEAIRVSCG